MTQAFLTARGISKRFVGVQALDDVSLTLESGEIRCLVGENGCGKSTLIKILSGVYRPDRGLITINGEDMHGLRPVDAIRRGIQVIYQDFSLFPNLSVAENIALNTQLEERRVWVRWSRIRDLAKQALAQIGLDIELDQPVGRLTVAHKQLVAIARALVHDVKLIIMDEPTTALTRREIDGLFAIIKKLQQQNISVLFVSHKLDEVFEISEQISILRNGKNVAQGPTARFERHHLVELMTGRALTQERPDFACASLESKTPLLKLKNLTRSGAFQDVCLTLHAGQILGLAGLLGSGRSELALSLFGLKPVHSGSITLSGQVVSMRHVGDAIEHGLAYVPEDRLSEGLFLERSVEKNLLATTAGKQLTPMRLLNRRRASALSRRCIEDWGIKTADGNVPVQTLSGGNQQKVVLAKWLATDAKILILNGPTVGVDIGAKMDIHTQIKELAAKGLALLVISDDLPELVQTCHRILVMHRGRIVETLAGSACTEARLQNTLNRLT